MVKVNNKHQANCSSFFSFLLTLNILTPNQILYCLNLNLSKDFKVGFKMKLSVTTVNNSFQPLPIFCHKELCFRSCIRAWIECCKIIHKSSKRTLGQPPSPHYWAQPSQRCPKNIFPVGFCFKLSFRFNNKWTKWN